MSVRPSEVLQQGRAFSLREVLESGVHQSASTVRKSRYQPRPVSAAAPAAPRAASTPAADGAAFSFALSQNAGTGLSAGAVAAAAATAPRTIRDNIRAAQHSSAVTAAESSEVLRLTAYVDELNLRLKKTLSRLEATEANLAKTSKLLVQEKSASERLFASYKKETAAASKLEQTLRGELKAALSEQRPSFESAVDLALEAEQKLSDQKEKLTGELQKLEETKAALDARVLELENEKTSAEKDLVSLKSEVEDATTTLATLGADANDARADLAVLTMQAAEAQNAAAQAVKEAEKALAMKPPPPPRVFGSVLAPRPLPAATAATAAALRPHVPPQRPQSLLAKIDASIGATNADRMIVAISTDVRSALQASVRASTVVV